MTSKTMAQQAALITSYASEAAQLAESLKMKAEKAFDMARRGAPAGDTPCLSAADLAERVNRLSRMCGYFDALQAIAYDREERAVEVSQ